VIFSAILSNKKFKVHLKEINEVKLSIFHLNLSFSCLLNFLSPYKHSRLRKIKQAIPPKKAKNLTLTAFAVFCLFTVAATTLGITESVSAASLSAIDFTGVVATNIGTRLSYCWFFITPKKTINVTDLGYFDKGQDGFLSSHDVGIYYSSRHFWSQEQFNYEDFLKLI
jgi:hypothetical protein